MITWWCGFWLATLVSTATSTSEQSFGALWNAGDVELSDEARATEFRSTLTTSASTSSRGMSASIGWRHMCIVIKEAASLQCFGVGKYLGYGDDKDRGAEQVATPPPSVDFGAGLHAVNVMLGEVTACAILSTGALKCWGYNVAGCLGYHMPEDTQIGDEPVEVGDNLVPVPLGSNRTAITLSMLPKCTCVLLDDGAVKCFGSNTLGERGAAAGGAMGDLLPAVDLGFGQVKGLAGGNSWSCALNASGSLKCWGYGGRGQLGYNDRSTRGTREEDMGENLPLLDLGVDLVAESIYAGWEHGCALLQNATSNQSGLVKCWGDNAQGFLGYGDRHTRGMGHFHSIRSSPFLDFGERMVVKELSLGYQTTCALMQDERTVKCYGSGGLLGYGDEDPRGVQANQLGDHLPTLDLGSRVTKVLRLFSGATARGRCAEVILDTTDPDLTGVVTSQSSMKCWGDNTFGQLGYGDRDSRGDGPDEMGNALPAINLQVTHTTSSSSSSSTTTTTSPTTPSTTSSSPTTTSSTMSSPTTTSSKSSSSTTTSLSSTSTTTTTTTLSGAVILGDLWFTSNGVSTQQVRAASQRALTRTLGLQKRAVTCRVKAPSVLRRRLLLDKDEEKPLPPRFLHQHYSVAAAVPKVTEERTGVQHVGRRLSAAHVWEVSFTIDVHHDLEARVRTTLDATIANTSIFSSQLHDALREDAMNVTAVDETFSMGGFGATPPESVITELLAEIEREEEQLVDELLARGSSRLRVAVADAVIVAERINAGDATTDLEEDIVVEVSESASVSIPAAALQRVGLDAGLDAVVVAAPFTRSTIEELYLAPDDKTEDEEEMEMVASRSENVTVLSAMSISMFSTEGGVYSVTGLNEPIVFTLPLSTPASQPVECAYWDESVAAWLSDGVWLVSVSNSTVTCATRHLTLFAAVYHGFAGAFICSQAQLLTREGAQQFFGSPSWCMTQGAWVMWCICFGFLSLLFMAIRIDWLRRDMWSDGAFLLPDATAVPEQAFEDGLIHNLRVSANLVREVKLEALGTFRDEQQKSTAVALLASVSSVILLLARAALHRVARLNACADCRVHYGDKYDKMAEVLDVELPEARKITALDSTKVSSASSSSTCSGCDDEDRSPPVGKIKDDCPLERAFSMELGEVACDSLTSEPTEEGSGPRAWRLSSLRPTLVETPSLRKFLQQMSAPSKDNRSSGEPDDESMDIAMARMIDPIAFRRAPSTSRSGSGQSKVSLQCQKQQEEEEKEQEELQGDALQQGPQHKPKEEQHKPKEERAQESLLRQHTQRAGAPSPLSSIQAPSQAQLQRRQSDLQRQKFKANRERLRLHIRQLSRILALRQAKHEERFGQILSLPCFVARPFFTLGPIGRCFVFSIFIRSATRVLLLCCRMIGAAAVTTFFLWRDGMPSASNPLHCTDSPDVSAMLGRLVAIGITAGLFAELPVAILSVLLRRRFKAIDYIGSPAYKRQLLRWHLRDVLLWILSAMYVLFCMYYCLLFIANVALEHHILWLVSALIGIFNHIFIFPFILNLIPTSLAAMVVVIVSVLGGVTRAEAVALVLECDGDVLKRRSRRRTFQKSTQSFSWWDTQKSESCRTRIGSEASSWSCVIGKRRTSAESPVHSVLKTNGPLDRE